MKKAGEGIDQGAGGGGGGGGVGGDSREGGLEGGSRTLIIVSLEYPLLVFNAFKESRNNIRVP